MLQRAWRRRLALRTCSWFGASVFLIWALRWSEFDLHALVRAGPRFAEFFTRLVPPDWSVTALVIHSTVETLMIAFAGTAIAVVVAMPLGFLAASNVTPAWVSHPIKWMLGAIRSIPLIVVAMLCVASVGLGPNVADVFDQG